MIDFSLGIVFTIPLSNPHSFHQPINQRTINCVACRPSILLFSDICPFVEDLLRMAASRTLLFGHSSSRHVNDAWDVVPIPRVQALSLPAWQSDATDLLQLVDALTSLALLFRRAFLPHVNPLLWILTERTILEHDKTSFPPEKPPGVFPPPSLDEEPHENGEGSRKY